MKKYLCLLAAVITYTLSIAQGVKIGGTGAPDLSAMLEIDGTSGKGLLLPRLTNTQMMALVAAEGMIIYNSTDASLYLRKANSWQKIADSNGSGSFTLPHTSSHSTADGYVLDLTNSSGSGTIKATHTSTGTALAGTSAGGIGIVGESNSGTGGSFSSVSGPSLVAMGGNVGIGNATPTKSRLHVNGTVGAVSAIFENGTGIAIENSHPGFGFNSYYNEGRKNIGNGFIGSMTLNPINGDLSILTSSVAGTANALNPVKTRLLFNAAGNVGIQGNVAPNFPLSFSDAIGDKISLWGSSPTSTYGMGIQPNLLQLYSATSTADIAFGYGSSTSFTERMRVKGDGKIGIGTSTPTYALTLAVDGDGFVHKGASAEIGTTTSALGGMLRTFTNHSLRFGAGTNVAQMILTTTGELGVGAALPNAKIHASFSQPELLLLENKTALAAGISSKAIFKSGSYYNGAIASVGTSANASRLAFLTGTSLTPGALSEKMSILDNGYVGINTTTPKAELDVNGKASVKDIEITGIITASGPDASAFTVKAPAPGTSIIIDHPACNFKPKAMLFVTSIGNSTGHSVVYDINTGRWSIYSSSYIVTGTFKQEFLNCNNMCITHTYPIAQKNTFSQYEEFNVLVIQR